MADNTAKTIDPHYELVSAEDHGPHEPLKNQYTPHDADSARNSSKNNLAGFDSDSPKRSRRTFSRLKWRITALLSKFRLQGALVPFRSTRAWMQRNEEVPIVKDRIAALLTTLIHIPAIAGVITLSFYIFKNYYIGKELQGPPNYDIEKKLGIQFAAKLMELFIVLSLSSILFAMIRHEFIIGEGVPYGALVAGQQITDISFLWSKEFLTVLTGKFSRFWKKLAFIVTIFIFTILALGASSLSATVMMPQEGDWRAGGSLIWSNSTYDEIFPLILSENNTIGSACNVTGNSLCPSWEWDVLEHQLVAKLPTSSRIVDGIIGPRPPRNVVLSGATTLSKLFIDVREKVFNRNSPNHTVASMPHFVPSDACVLSSLDWELASDAASKTGNYRFNLYSKIQHLLTAPQPMTHTRCHRSSMNADDLTEPSFPDFRSWEYPTINITSDDITDWMSETLPDLETPEVFWFSPESDMAANASVGVIVAVPTDDTDQPIDVYGCMIDARWVSATLTGDAVSLLSEGYPAFSDALATSLGGSWILSPTYGQKTQIQPSFAKYLNPFDSRSNHTVIHEMLLTSGIWTSKGSGSRSEKHLEAILGVLATNGLARSAPNTSAITTLADPSGEWWKNFMPQNGKVFGPGGNPYAITTEDQAKYFGTEMETWLTGYAFADNSLTMLGAMGVFYVYVAFVVAFSIWSIWTGITSSSWESVPELLALSLTEQDAAQKMRSLDEDAFMKENYCIAVEDNQLRLRTTQGSVPMENRVKPNEFYG
ncbi:hypothetical protein G7Z17_g8366 [Cylindrodendrum hubeiense]|uniref:Uncharacterized protein n=1 Tax=Cylindrodendrum hubeiense TaxID=595255 RepID=A0A9P5LER9_9HYPO|nr:hypothetical protein G7Z17_g8366 [Cylindrodendrum hubeiense]